jgi:putative GTP pyrophosphokinase
MAEDSHQRILREYDERLDLYRDLTSTVEGLIKRMLREQGIRFHSVTSRVKDRESLQKKIARPDKNYTQLSDLTDIAGTRIITYFEDDVDTVKEFLEAQFSIDWANTVDRRKTLEPDRFGYLSMQHVAEFGSDRTSIFEYRKFSGLTFEIQTRSILQHAWAEMEHDLGYKTPESIPKEHRRRFSRLAGLLEIADDEFRRLRDELDRYRRDVQERIKRNPKEVKIDKDSLSAFFASNSLVHVLDEEISSLTRLPLQKPAENDPRVRYASDGDVGLLKPLQIDTIQELETALAVHREELTAFVTTYWQLLEERPTSGHFPPGVSVFYLAYMLAAKTLDREGVRRYLQEAGIQFRGSSSEALVDRIKEAYELINEQDS